MANQSKIALPEPRCSASELKLLDRAAAIKGQSLSEFIVASARNAAVQAIAPYEALDLSADDQETFAERLLNPDSIAEPLARAAERRRQLLDPA